MDNLIGANDVLFVLLGAIMALAMHAGFAFLEVGTVRHKNQVNALVKILVSVVRFRPGPPRNTKTTFGWFFRLYLLIF
jgi:hypothetical protein